MSGQMRGEKGIELMKEEITKCYLVKSVPSRVNTLSKAP